MKFRDDLELSLGDVGADGEGLAGGSDCGRQVPLYTQTTHTHTQNTHTHILSLSLSLSHRRDSHAVQTSIKQGLQGAKRALALPLRLPSQRKKSTLGVEVDVW